MTRTKAGAEKAIKPVRRHVTQLDGKTILSPILLTDKAH